MNKAFKNTTKVVIAGIKAGEQGKLPVNPDGFLVTKELREFAAKGYLIEVKASSPEVNDKHNGKEIK